MVCVQGVLLEGRGVGGVGEEHWVLPSLDRLVGLVVRRPPRERKTPGSNPACAGIFLGVESYQ